MNSEKTRLRSFRLVCAPELRARVTALLEAEGYAFGPEPFSPWCMRLEAEPRPLGGSLAALFGYVYIQDRSSMLPPLALAPQAGSAVLDICASPGSKSGFLAQLVGPQGFVLANEPSQNRLQTLRANLHQLNLIHAGTCNHDGSRLPLRAGSWRNILLDPPCSGWGTVEKNPQVLKLWSGDKVKPLVALQRQLLRHAARLLAAGGRLVYSTCTTNVQENEEQVLFAEQELGLERVPLTPFGGFAWDELPGGAGTLRVDGGKSDAQGFYVALFRKPADAMPLADVQELDPAPANAGKGLPGEALAPRMLAGPCLDPAQLPDGQVLSIGGQVRFVPRAATGLLPAGFGWQAGLLGRSASGNFQPAPRLRCLVPSDPQDGALVLEEVSAIRALLSGQSLQTGLAGREAMLWWRDVPLGRVALKQGRAVATFR